MENYFDRQFELRYFEMDKFGEAPSTTILTLLEETAADHCYSIDYSLYDLVEQNVGWVLRSGVMQMERFPKYKEKIVIRTWLSNYSTIRGFRHNIIYDEQGNIIGRSKGLWVFFDIKKRRPIKIFDDIRKKWSYCNEECINHDISQKIDPIDSASYTEKFMVNRYDTDMNKHVNNIRYLQWLIESLPEELIDNYYLHFIDGRFVAEAEYGDIVISTTKKDVDENSFIHTIKIQGSNKVCSTAKTIWKKRKLE
jgi:acyl-ACP thioesterase